MSIKDKTPEMGFLFYYLHLFLKCLNLSMKKIVIKEIDVYSSKLFKGKIISEYLIYVELDGTRLYAYTELGEDAKKERVNELILEQIITEDTITINKDEVIEEFCLEEVINGKKCKTQTIH